MNDLDLIQNTRREIVSTGSDPFAAYGAKVGKTGQYLSFKNGEFLYGQTNEELPLDSRLIANMPGLRIGWRRWFDGQVTDDLTELLVDQVPMRPRTELGDNDPALWERDDTGKPRDPWQLTNVLELSDGEETYIYSTGSKGGIGAIGRLCTAYARERRQRPDMLPIIKLGRDFYNHAQYGKTYFPVFEIVGWTDAEDPSLDSDGDDVPFEPEKPAEKPKAAAVTEPAARRVTKF